MNETISWQAPEHLHTEKTSDWYWIVGIVTLSIALIAIILDNLIFGILIIMCALTLSLYASKKPRIVSVKIDNRGVTVGTMRYPYDNLDSFWVETRQAVPKILLKSKKLFMPFIAVLIEEVDPEEVRSILLNYLPEEEHTEPLLEKLLIYLGF